MLNQNYFRPWWLLNIYIKQNSEIIFFHSKILKQMDDFFKGKNCKTEVEIFLYILFNFYCNTTFKKLDYIV